MNNQSKKSNTENRKDIHESRFAEVCRLYRKNTAAVIGLVILLIFVLIAIFADVIVPYEAGIKQSAADRLLGPCAEHIFGTDRFGRDVFARIIHGSRRSLALGLGTTLLSALIGGTIGMISAYAGGLADAIIMRICDVFMSIPSMLFALAVVSVLGANMLNLIIAITIITIPTYIRVVRSVVLSITDQDYIHAARLCGAGNLAIITQHILPNALAPIIVQASMNVASMMLAAASLSFIGMGIQPPTPEWGSMLDSAREYMDTKPYLLFFPGLAIAFSALSLNLVGDGLRDALDPRLKN